MHEEPVHNRNLLLAIVVLTSLINPFLSAATNIALPKIGAEFGMHAVSLSWVAMSFLISSAALLVPFGKLADIIGRKRVFLWGNVLMVLASLFCTFSVSGSMLIGARILQGIGSAMMLATGMAIITSAFPLSERGRVIGINVSAVYLGLTAAPIIGGLLTQSFGWRSLFWVAIVIGLVVVITTIITVRTDWKEAKHDKFDTKGTAFYILSVFTLMFGFSKLPEWYAFVLTLAGLVGLWYFIKIESLSEFPILDIRLFKHNRVFAYSNLSALINYAATFAIGFVLSLYLQYVKGMSPRDAGIVLVTSPIMMTIFANIAGRLSDKFDSRILASIGMALSVVGLIMLAFLTDSFSTSYVIGTLVILGTGFGLFSSPNTNAVMSSVEKRYLGVASATVGTMRLTGQMLSMGLATMMLHIFVGDAQITPANHQMFMLTVRVIFGLFSILCFLGIFASLARGPKDKN